MRGAVFAVLGLLTLGAAVCGADTYTVRIVGDSGSGSLRWAIGKANSHAGPDSIVFASVMKGKTIQPTYGLPPISDDDTTLNADIDADGKPDVYLEGGAFDGAGLAVWGDRCTVAGLGVLGWSQAGIAFENAADGVIRSCYFGFRGAGYGPNAVGLHLFRTTSCRVGGSTAAQRNVFGCFASMESYCLLIEAAQDNRVMGNYFGLRPDGVTAPPEVSYAGIVVMAYGDTRPSGNVIGGSQPGQGNVIDNVDYGVVLSHAESNSILGNYIGLDATGFSGSHGAGTGVLATNSSTDNAIGGTSSGARNLFAGQWGIMCDDGAASNRILGNWFGLTASGTQLAPLYDGVGLTGSAGPQTIGGSTATAGNWFCGCVSNPLSSVGVSIAGGATGTLVRNNRFGALPGGGEVPTKMKYGVRVTPGNTSHPRIDIQDNLFTRCLYGLCVSGSLPRVHAYRNTFRKCTTACQAQKSGRLFLGDLGNSTTADDGGNVFQTSNKWHIRNNTIRTLKAEGNQFYTTSRAKVDPKIWDQLDDPSLGLVDIDPLIGGVHPAGSTQPVGVALTAAVALPTAGGAEVAFTLSAPAAVSVEVLNIAGRPVAAVTPAGACPMTAGAQRLLWNGHTAAGTAAPAGRYLVRISAVSPSGGRTTAICALHLAT